MPPVVRLKTEVLLYGVKVMVYHPCTRGTSQRVFKFNNAPYRNLRQSKGLLGKFDAMSFVKRPVKRFAFELYNRPIRVDDTSL